MLRQALTNLKYTFKICFYGEVIEDRVSVSREYENFDDDMGSDSDSSTGAFIAKINCGRDFTATKKPLQDEKDD